MVTYHWGADLRDKEETDEEQSFEILRYTIEQASQATAVKFSLQYKDKSSKNDSPTDAYEAEVSHLRLMYNSG